MRSPRSPLLWEDRTSASDGLSPLSLLLPLSQLLERRFRRWFPDPPPIRRLELEERWARLRDVLKKAAPSRTWAHLKTLAGAWITSARVGILTPKGCRFGCTHDNLGREVPAPDSIGHYLSCPRLAHLLALPRAIIPSGPIIRLGLGPASDYNVAREFDPISHGRANYLTAVATTTTERPSTVVSFSSIPIAKVAIVLQCVRDTPRLSLSAEAGCQTVPS